MVKITDFVFFETEMFIDISSGFVVLSNDVYFGPYKMALVVLPFGKICTLPRNFSGLLIFFVVIIVYTPAVPVMSGVPMPLSNLST